MSRPESLSAWWVVEGDVLASGETTVVSVQRDPASGQVALATEDGARRTLRRDDKVMVARRAADTLMRPSRVRVSIRSARRRRRRSTGS